MVVSYIMFVELIFSMSIFACDICQQGLLQSEPEGEHNENIGFYGRCVSHAIVFSSHVNPKKEYFRNNNWTCARTEVMLFEHFYRL
jgi:hypothetical protein